MNITCDNIFCKVCPWRNTSVATKILFHFCSRQVGHLSKTKHTTTDSCPLMVQWSNADPINQIHRQNVGWPAASGGQAAASRAEFSTLLCKPLRFSSFQKVSKWFINHIYISPIFHPILVEIPNLYRGYEPFSGARTPMFSAWTDQLFFPAELRIPEVSSIWVLGLSGLLFCQTSMLIVII